MPHTVELVIDASMGAVSGLAEIAFAYTRLTGHKLIIRKESRAQLEERLISDTPGDLIVQTTSVMDSVIGRGKVVESSTAIFARAAVGRERPGRRYRVRRQPSGRPARIRGVFHRHHCGCEGARRREGF